MTGCDLEKSCNRICPLRSSELPLQTMIAPCACDWSMLRRSSSCRRLWFEAPNCFRYLEVEKPVASWNTFSTSITRRRHAIEAIIASVDFPVPRMPINTMDAFGSNTRRDSTGGIGVGVVRGVDGALDCIESAYLLEPQSRGLPNIARSSQAQFFEQMLSLTGSFNT